MLTITFTNMYLTRFSLAFICFINFSLLCPCFYLCSHFYYYLFQKLRSLIATSSLCKLVKMTDHDQLCGHTGGHTVKLYHKSNVLICFKALQVISGFTPAYKFHSEVCGCGTQIPTKFGSYKIDLLTSSAYGIFGLNLFLFNSCIRRLTVLLRYQAARKFGVKFILV